MFLYLKSTLTVPKMMDMVYTPQQKYQEIYNIANKTETLGTTRIDLLPTDDDESAITATANVNMKNELKNFLKHQMGNI